MAVLIVGSMLPWGVSAQEAPAGEDAPIQPGAHWGIPGALDGCTLNFVFRDREDRLYIGTAGHCAGALEVGDEARLFHDGSRIGEFVFIHPPDVGCWDHNPAGTCLAPDPDALVSGFDGDDFALIAIDQSRYGDVSPKVRHWGGPTGIAAPGGPQPGELVAMYGHGFGIPHEVGGRPGSLRSFGTSKFGAEMLTRAGDSGSPVIHAETGTAIGIVQRALADTATAGLVSGPTVARALELAAEAGFELELLTAPLASRYLLEPGWRGPPAESQVEVVRPGMGVFLDGPVGRVVCTMGFLFEAAGDRYATTAGHCALAAVGADPDDSELEYEDGAVPVYLWPGGLDGGDPRIGEVVYAAQHFEPFRLNDDLPPYMDLALIRLDHEVTVDPSVCLFGGPTSINHDVSHVPIEARFYGSGQVGYSYETGTSVLPGRTAVVVLHEEGAPRASFISLESGGDSGSPFVDTDGRALGTLTGAGRLARLGPGIGRAGEVLGLDFELLTAPLVEGAPPVGKDPGCVP